MATGTAKTPTPTGTIPRPGWEDVIYTEYEADLLWQAAEHESDELEWRHAEAYWEAHKKWVAAMEQTLNSITVDLRHISPGLLERVAAWFQRGGPCDG